MDMAGSITSLSELETKILHLLQHQFPLVERPFRHMADVLALEEEAVIDCVERLYNKGLIRRFGASVNSRKIGYVSILAAAKVRQECIETIASLINAFPEVTHNYLREGEYNIWFTVIANTQERLNQILYEIELAHGLDALLRLPAKKVFKVSVKFPLIAG